MLISRRQLWADLALLTITLVWGSTFVMVKNAVANFPVFPFLALRFLLASVVLAVFFHGRLLALGRRGMAAGVLIGLFLFAGYAFQTWGLRDTTASKAGFITGLSVVIVPVLSTLWLRQKPSLGVLAGVALATIGLGLLSLNENLSVSRGDLLVLGCAFSFALQITAVSAFVRWADALSLAIVQLVTVTVLSGLASLVTEPLPTVFPPSVLGAAAFTGVLATAFAFSVQNVAQTFTTAVHTALIFTAEPVFAALFGVLLAGDVLTARAWWGCGLILTGMIAAEIGDHQTIYERSTK
ncbi:MAG: DMT family transporter [Chloroflexi bacterium]|nr:DMT family transporter [Chloroflexota bacterium]